MKLYELIFTVYWIEIAYCFESNWILFDLESIEDFFLLNFTFLWSLLAKFDMPSSQQRWLIKVNLRMAPNSIE